MFAVNRAIGKDEYFKTVFHRIGCIAAQAFQCALQGARFTVGAEVGLQGFRLKNAGIYAPDFL